MIPWALIVRGRVTEVYHREEDSDGSYLTRIPPGTPEFRTALSTLFVKGTSDGNS